MREAVFPAYNCPSDYVCTNRGYEYASCRPNVFPDQVHSAEVTCLVPAESTLLYKRVLSGAIGAVVVGGLSYAIGGEERLWPGVAMGGALGLIFGGYA